ncbi:uncharacterized protein LAESUDRAFT_66283 [Laetiporus sulphureus 93-53]|uniref:DRBM domain-containing protein n=1 Tax=Laetiporus sulphureus 93-53 TaxID=1314785 RepID=A0A165F581_9APHY|nr:uncharacterized protein LAESUDRAFT_66283 [Laetiporus sulphureus 93-53]KZT08414.1 hypothetical protein LAESUDRAFT_66283 [Laetiporus sulphureus 93-53]
MTPPFRRLVGRDQQPADHIELSVMCPLAFPVFCLGDDHVYTLFPTSLSHATATYSVSSRPPGLWMSCSTLNAPVVEGASTGRINVLLGCCQRSSSIPCYNRIRRITVLRISMSSNEHGPRQQLNNHLQRNGLMNSLVWETTKTGSGRNIAFTAKAYINGVEHGTGTSANKGEAMDRAATQTLLVLRG